MRYCARPRRALRQKPSPSTNAWPVARYAILPRGRFAFRLDPPREQRQTKGLFARFLLLLLLTCWSITAFGSSKRPKQDYGGPPPATAAPTLMWVPRVTLFPVWLVSEYVVREPLGALVRTAEKNHWTDEIISFFTFGERRNITIFPSALFDFGLKPSVGFNLTWKYFLAEPNTLKVHFGTWGPDWIAARANDDYSLTPKQHLLAGASFVNRRDLPFFGMGPRSPSDPRLRYQALTSELSLGYQNDFWRASELVTRVGFRSLSFGDAGCCSEPSLSDRVDSGAVPAPPGYRDDYVAEFQSISVALDSRRALPQNGTGVRLEGHGEAIFAPGSAEKRRAWLGYGASLGAAIDFWRGRTVGLGIRGDLTDPLLGTIPFTDQVSLGGDKPMRGFLPGRLVDRSAVVATANYVWPVWVFLNGVVQADVGNVFGEHFDGFDARLARLSTAIGIRSNGSPESGLEVLVAGATDPFENGFHYSSFRLVIGSHHGL